MIFLINSILTVSIPFDIPTPLIAPMMQYVVETGIPRKVKNNTHTPAPNWAANPEKGSKMVIPLPIVSITRWLKITAPKNKKRVPTKDAGVLPINPEWMTGPKMVASSFAPVL